MIKISRSDALRKCIVIFEAIRRAASKGNAGLVPERGAEDSFYLDSAILESLREMLREMEATEKIEAQKDGINKTLNDWQDRIVKFGVPERMDLNE